jgi:hypothetical protein
MHHTEVRVEPDDFQSQADNRVDVGRSGLPDSRLVVAVVRRVRAGDASACGAGRRADGLARSCPRRDDLERGEPAAQQGGDAADITARPGDDRGGVLGIGSWCIGQVIAPHGQQLV